MSPSEPLLPEGDRPALGRVGAPNPDTRQRFALSGIALYRPMLGRRCALCLPEGEQRDEAIYAAGRTGRMTCCEGHIEGLRQRLDMLTINAQQTVRGDDPDDPLPANVADFRRPARQEIDT